jgi:hypothetical protein
MKTLAPSFCTCRGNILTKLFVFACALVATFALMWMLLMPSIVTGIIKKRTGFDATVQRLYVNPFTASVYVGQFKINNPDTFPQDDFVLVNEFRTAIEPNSVFSDRVVVRDALFDVAFIAVVKNAQGETNLDVFKASMLPAGPEEKTPDKKSQLKPAAAPKKEAPTTQFLIRHLVVKLDKIIIADYSGPEPKVHEITVKINHTFTDITDIKQISVPLLADLSVAGAGKLADNILGVMLPAPVLQQLGVVGKDAGGILQGTGKKTKDLFKGLFDSLEEKPKQ